MRLPAAQARAFYAAYRAFAELAAGPGAMVTSTLAPGDCVIFDNTRILHGRTAFADGGGTGGASTGRRHLQGCYADLDGLASAVAVLARGQASQSSGASQDGQAGQDEQAGQAGS
jgi:gamma-butyrobetaine dioxygenase